MTPDLPDNLADWPAGDFDILGVPKTAADDDIRRAYTRLIRRFKPEHFPEHFQRIRSAYDSCREQAEWYRRVAESEQQPVEDAPQPDAVVELPAWTNAAADAPPDEVDRLWHIAIGGDLETAYAGLVNECAASQRADLPLRLYWLLSLQPGLDAQRERHHWLAEGLRRARPLAGPAVELYRRELELVRALSTLTQDYVDLLKADADTADRFTVARMRLNAAGRQGLFDFMLLELNDLKPRIGIDGETAWLALVVKATEWAAGKSAADDLRSYCVDELKALEHLAMPLGHLFDRVDECEVWNANRNTGRWYGSLAPFLKLLHDAWAGDGEVPADLLRSGLAAIVSSPWAALDLLDRLLQDRPELQFQALMTLERHRRDGGEGPADEHLRGLARHLFHNLVADMDATVRRRILEWLIRDGVHPMELADALEADPESKYRALGQTVRQDFSLRIVWLAVEVCRDR